MKREVIIDALYSFTVAVYSDGHKPISGVKSTFETILRQLESQGIIKKILVQQMLSEFPTQVTIKLEESRGLNDPWTVSNLEQSLQHYITIYANAQ